MTKNKQHLLNGIAGMEERIAQLRTAYVQGDMPLEEYCEAVQTLRAEIESDTLYLNYC